MAAIRKDRKKAVAHADKWFSLYIRERDNNRSVLSGSTERIQCGHVITRARYATRWDERNAFAQTAGENMRHEFDPNVFIMWFADRFGWHAYEELVRLSWTTRKWKTHEIRAIGDEYKRRYEELKGDA